MSEATEEKDDKSTSFAIELDGGRWRHLFWAVVGIGVGVVVAVHMGSIGYLIGGLVAVGGVNAAIAFAKTLMHPPGELRLGERELVLPLGLSTGKSATLEADELRNAYVLRRALPWNQSGPLLVLETRRGVFEYPREWFAADGDQRRVAAALNRRLGHIP
jgi:hypothetical protein